MARGNAVAVFVALQATTGCLIRLPDFTACKAVVACKATNTATAFPASK